MFDIREHFRRHRRGQTFIGITQSLARSTISDGNKKCNWQVFSLLFHKLLEYYGNVLAAKHHQYIIEEFISQKSADQR